MKKIFVTGANGLLGSFICRELINNDYRVKVMYRQGSDLSQLEDIRHELEWVQGDIFDVFRLPTFFEDVDTLVHAAGMVSYNSADYQALYKTNVEGTANVVNACIMAGTPKILHLSSIAAIGKDKSSEVLDENAKWINSRQNTAYAKSKYLGELEVWRGFMEGLQGVILNPSVVLGPGDLTRSSPRIFKYVWDKNPFFTPGSMNYVDVRDLAAITLKLLESDYNLERFIINAGNISYHDFFKKTGYWFNKKPPTIKVGQFGLKAAGWIDRMKSGVTGKPPHITRDLRRVLTSNTLFNNQKIKDACQFQFRDLDDTIRWSCEKIMDELYIKE